jgi:hypothetical protein
MSSLPLPALSPPRPDTRPLRGGLGGLAAWLLLALAGCTSASLSKADGGAGGSGGSPLSPDAGDETAAGADDGADLAGGNDALADERAKDGDDAAPEVGGEDAAPDALRGSGGGGGVGGTGSGGSGSGGTGSGGSGSGGALDAGGDDGGGDAAPDLSQDGGGEVGTVGVTPTQPGQLVISEIMIDTATITDDEGEWFELYNPSATVTYDLQGCTLTGTNAFNVVDQSLIITPGAFITLARATDETTVGFPLNYSYGPTIKFANEGGSLTVACGPSAATIIDTVSYTIDEVVKGRSFSLSPAHYDATQNDTPANWCPGAVVYRTTGPTTDYGSPNKPNPDCP